VLTLLLTMVSKAQLRYIQDNAKIAVEQKRLSSKIEEAKKAYLNRCSEGDECKRLFNNFVRIMTSGHGTYELGGPKLGECPQFRKFYCECIVKHGIRLPFARFYQIGRIQYDVNSNTRIIYYNLTIL